MKRVILTLIIIVSCFSSSYSQSGVKDSVIRFPFVGVSYGIYQPGGDLSDRFGVTSMLSGDVLFKSKKNLLYGFSGGFMFGDKVKEPDLLKSIYTQNEQIIGYDGLYADVRIFERGYQFSGTFGKIFAFKKPNPNSGIMVIGGPGFLQHKIRIENVGNTAPQLTKEYLKGYDRLTNGLMLREFVGYVYFSNHQLVNFYAGVEFIQAFTESRRDYNFDTPELKDSEKRTDLLYGFKIGWVLPLYKKETCLVLFLLNMTLLYLVAVKLYAFAIVIASLFNKKAAQWVSGRKNWKSKIASVLKPGEKRLLFHCASFGEFEQGKPVLEALKNHYPQHKIVLTFFSPSGYENKKNDPLADYVFYLPVDGPFNSKNFIELIQPEMAFFVKYDFWHYYIKTFKDKKIPVYFVSSIFRPTQIFFQWYGKFFDKMLRRVTHFFVQNQGSLELLYKNSIPQVTVTGDTRFDRVFEASQNRKPLAEIETFKGKHKLFVAGSTWGADEQLVAALIPDLESDYKIIVVPHEIKEVKISKLKTLLGTDAIRFSEWDKKQTSARILIIDNMGMLSAIYQYADLVYIGGGFGKGIHNILEAAVYGTPIIFGPKYKKFREADELVHWKGAFSINNERGLRDKVFELIHEPGRIDKIKEINTRYINNNKGATDLIINYLKMNP